MQEPPEVGVVHCECLQGLEGVGDDQPWPAFPQHSRYLLNHAGQPDPASGLAEIGVEDRLADGRGVEEAQALPEPDDLLQRLGHRREVDDRAVLASIGKRVLLRHDCPAGPWQAHDDADPARGQAAAKYLVKRPVAAAKSSVGHHKLLLGQERAGAQQDPDGGDELQRIKRLEQERVRARVQSGVPALDRRHRDDRYARVLLEEAAELQARRLR
jgi:hypothetical protein